MSSLYRSRFIDCAAGAVQYSYRNFDLLWDNVIAGPKSVAEPMRGLRQGLKEAGYVEGENLTIEYRWANNQTERVPAMAAERGLLVKEGDDAISASRYCLMMIGRYGETGIAAAPRSFAGLRRLGGWMSA